ncbi:hypothetical protein D0T49_10920 [Paludibacter sp. 221]|nr:hypothetical protein [Paludibacter sp. 221]
MKKSTVLSDGCIFEDFSAEDDSTGLDTDELQSLLQEQHELIINQYSSNSVPASAAGLNNLLFYKPNGWNRVCSFQPFFYFRL